MINNIKKVKYQLALINLNNSLTDRTQIPYLCIMLMRWIRNFFFWLYAKRQGKLRKQITPVSIQEAKCIGILFSATNHHDNEVIVAYCQRLKQQRKQVELMAYLPKREFGDKLPFEYFTNWLGKANNANIDRFIKTHFDILINFQVKAKLPLEYIAVANKAQYKVSFSPDIDIANYDLILISKENSDIANAIKNLEKYLQ